MKFNEHIVPVLAAVFLFSCGDKQAQQKQGPPPAVPVTVANVASTNAVYYDQYPISLPAGKLLSCLLIHKHKTRLIVP